MGKVGSISAASPALSMMRREQEGAGSQAAILMNCLGLLKLNRKDKVISPLLLTETFEQLP